MNHGGAYPDLDARLSEAEEHLRHGRFDEALHALHKAAEEHPDSPLPWHDLGAAWMSRLRADVAADVLWEDRADDESAWQQAHEAFLKALAFDPNFVPSLNDLGALAAMHGQKGQAVEFWERSLAVNPGQDAIRADLEALRAKLR